MITRVSFSSEESGGSEPAMTSVLNHMAEQMEALQLMFTQSDVSRGVVDQRLAELTDEVRSLTCAIDAGQGDALRRVAEGQEALIALMSSGDGGDGIDAESRMRLRSIDVQLLRILEEISAGRQEAVAELRSDLTALTKSLWQNARSGGDAKRWRCRGGRGRGSRPRSGRDCRCDDRPFAGPDLVLAISCRAIRPSRNDYRPRDRA